jgi:TctA family transporter
MTGTTTWRQGPVSDAIPAAPASASPELRAEAQRWVRRKRILYTILGIYLALSIMWFAIDMADGTESTWFYWPMLGTGIAVAITAVVLFGIGGLFGVGWEARQVDRYVRARGGDQQR